MSAREHLNENKVIYAILALLGGGATTATLTDNLPVTQGEFRVHNETPHKPASEAIEKIQGSLDVLVLQQLRGQLLQAYKDKCRATDTTALEYINQEIESLQAQYVAITSSRYEPPPCGVAP